MVGTVVEVITHAICGEGTATALRHGFLIISVAGGRMHRLLRIVRTERYVSVQRNQEDTTLEVIELPCIESHVKRLNASQ